MRGIMKVNELQEIVLSLESFKVSDVESKMILGYFESHDYEIIIKSLINYLKILKEV